MDAEQSVLGAMLESKEAIANVIEIVKSEDFYKPAHSEIYQTILDLYGRGERPDAITVAEELNRRGSLDHIGGKPYIHGLLEAYPTASSAAGYARIVEEHALLRKLIEAGTEVADLGFSMPEDVADAVDKAEEIVYQVGDRRLARRRHADPPASHREHGSDRAALRTRRTPNRIGVRIPRARRENPGLPTLKPDHRGGQT